RQVPREIAQLKADLAAAGAPAERAKLETSVRLAESYLAEVKALKPALPTIAFERTMKLYRGDREIHLLYLGRAHTEGDVFVYLPKERTVITGDAVIGWTPYMGDGYPEDWVTTIDRLAELDFDTIVMGHGNPAAAPRSAAGSSPATRTASRPCATRASDATASRPSSRPSTARSPRRAASRAPCSSATPRTIPACGRS